MLRASDRAEILLEEFKHTTTEAIVHLSCVQNDMFSEVGRVPKALPTRVQKLLHVNVDAYSLVARIVSRSCVVVKQVVYRRRVMQVLRKWRAAGHKALLFTQTQQMLDIIEHHVAAAGMHYLRMDGSVPPPARFRMIDAFNRQLPPGTPTEAPLPGPGPLARGGAAAAGAAERACRPEGEALEDDDVAVASEGAHASGGAEAGGQGREEEDDVDDDRIGDAEQVRCAARPMSSLLLQTSSHLADANFSHSGIYEETCMLAAGAWSEGGGGAKLSPAAQAQVVG